MNESTLNGKVDEFVAVLQKNAVVMAAAKVPQLDIITSLNSKKGFVVTTTAEQEGLKTDLKTKTTDVAKAVSDLYDEFSSRIEAVAGLVGKKTPLGEQILQLRTDLLRRSVSRNGAEETSNTSPAPVSSASSPSVPHAA